MNEHTSKGTATSSSSGPASFQLPLAKPRWTYVLLAINLMVWLAMTLFGLLNGLGLEGSQNVMVLVIFGAQQNELVAQGDYWRLFTSMFLHIGLVHLAFNSYALYILGRDIESLFGAKRFLVVYFLSGLGGSVTTFALGGNAVSAGASGAIFGLIGAEIAYFFVHREMFGQRGQAQLRNLLFVAVINLFLGATVPGINNWAHMGGLVFGALMGFQLAPRYQAPSILIANEVPTLEDRNSLQKQIPSVGLLVLVMLVLTWFGTQY
jgi:rhomboid protease GluP